MLGRMRLSGEIHEPSDEQWDVVSRVISFSRSAVPVIKNGASHRFGPKVRSCHYPEEWQAVQRLSNDGAQILVVAHRFGVRGRAAAPPDSDVTYR
jgi:alpha-galactosidase